MATKSRRTKVATFRVRFDSASDAKSVVESINKFEVERKGRTLTISEDDRKAFARITRRLDLEGNEVGAVGRPAATDKPEKAAKTAKTAKAEKASKKPKRPADDLDDDAPVGKRRPASTKVGKKAKAEKVSKKAKAERAETSGKTKPVMTMKVVSSNIDRIWYNLEKDTLTVLFHNGRKYRYNSVSVRELKRFATAPSQGEWFNENIKGVKEYVEIG